MSKDKKGTTKATGRRYDLEYKNYQGTEEQKKNRATRNAARAKLEKQGRVHKGDGKDVDHVRGVGKGNANSNLRVQTEHQNRSYPRNKNAGKKK